MVRAVLPGLTGRQWNSLIGGALGGGCRGYDGSWTFGRIWESVKREDHQDSWLAIGDEKWQ
eukprot:1447105-Amphidinium_carterae.1